jgi:hypothetical protein
MLFAMVAVMPGIFSSSVSSTIEAPAFPAFSRMVHPPIIEAHKAQSKNVLMVAS